MNDIQYNLTTKLNDDGLKRMQSGLTALKKDLIEITNGTNKAAQAAQKMTSLGSLNFDKSINSARKYLQSIDDIQEALSRSYNPNFKFIDFSKFQSELNKAGVSMKQFRNIMSNDVFKATPGMNSYLQSLVQINEHTKRVSQASQKMFTTFGNAVRWNIAANGLDSFVASIRNSLNYLTELDSSLTQIRIVSDQSAESMRKFALEANQSAKSLGKSTTDYTNAALIFYQQGLSETQSKKMADLTLKTANVTQQSTREASEELTSLMNGYHVAVDDMEASVDKLAAVAAASASDLEELATAESKVASVAHTLGVSQDQLASQLSTVISVTRQAPENVGNAFKTLYARLADLKQGGADGAVTLGKISQTLSNAGVQVLTTSGDLRGMGDILEDLMDKWQGFSTAQKQALAQTLAGKYQYNNLLSLLSNKDMYDKMLAVSQDSLGTIDKQQGIYMESVEAKVQALETSFEGLMTTVFNADNFKPAIDALTTILDKTNDIVTALGGTQGTFSQLMAGSVAIGGRMFNQQIARSINRGVVNAQTKSIGEASREAAIKQLQAYGVETTPNDEYTRRFVEIAQRGLIMSPNMTEEEQRDWSEQMKKLADAFVRRQEANSRFTSYGKGTRALLKDEKVKKWFDDLMAAGGEDKGISVRTNLQSKLGEIVGRVQNGELDDESARAVLHLLGRMPKKLQEEGSALIPNIDDYHAIGSRFNRVEKEHEQEQEANNIPKDKREPLDVLTYVKENVQTYNGRGDNVTNDAKRDKENADTLVRYLYEQMNEKSVEQGNVQYLNSILDIGSAVSGLTFSMMSLKEVASTLFDDSLTAGQKFERVLENMLVTAPMLVSSLIQYSAAMKSFRDARETYKNDPNFLGSEKKSAAAAAADANALAEGKEAAATSAAARAKRDKAQAEADSAKATAAETRASNENAAANAAEGAAAKGRGSKTPKIGKSTLKGFADKAIDVGVGAGATFAAIGTTIKGGAATLARGAMRAVPYIGAVLMGIDLISLAWSGVSALIKSGSKSITDYANDAQEKAQKLQDSQAALSTLTDKKKSFDALYHTYQQTGVATDELLSSAKDLNDALGNQRVVLDGSAESFHNLADAADEATQKQKELVASQADSAYRAATDSALAQFNQNKDAEGNKVFQKIQAPYATGFVNNDTLTANGALSASAILKRMSADGNIDALTNDQLSAVNSIYNFVGKSADKSATWDDLINARRNASDIQTFIANATNKADSANLNDDERKVLDQLNEYVNTLINSTSDLTNQAQAALEAGIDNLSQSGQSNEEMLRQLTSPGGSLTDAAQMYLAANGISTGSNDNIGQQERALASLFSSSSPEFSQYLSEKGNRDSVTNMIMDYENVPADIASGIVDELDSRQMQAYVNVAIKYESDGRTSDSLSDLVTQELDDLNRTSDQTSKNSAGITLTTNDVVEKYGDYQKAALAGASDDTTKAMYDLAGAMGWADGQMIAMTGSPQDFRSAYDAYVRKATTTSQYDKSGEFSDYTGASQFFNSLDEEVRNSLTSKQQEQYDSYGSDAAGRRKYLESIGVDADTIGRDAIDQIVSYVISETDMTQSGDKILADVATNPEIQKLASEWGVTIDSILPNIVNFLYSSVGNIDAAEDLASSAMVSQHDFGGTQLTGYNGSGDISTYVTGAVHRNKLSPEYTSKLLSQVSGVDSISADQIDQIADSLAQAQSHAEEVQKAVAGIDSGLSDLSALTSFSQLDEEFRRTGTASDELWQSVLSLGDALGVAGGKAYQAAGDYDDYAAAVKNAVESSGRLTDIQMGTGGYLDQVYQKYLSDPSKIKGSEDEEKFTQAAQGNILASILNNRGDMPSALADAQKAFAALDEVGTDYATAISDAAYTLKDSLDPDEMRDLLTGAANGSTSLTDEAKQSFSEFAQTYTSDVNTLLAVFSEFMSGTISTTQEAADAVNDIAKNAGLSRRETVATNANAATTKTMNDLAGTYGIDTESDVWKSIEEQIPDPSKYSTDELDAKVRNLLYGIGDDIDQLGETSRSALNDVMARSRAEYLNKRDSQGNLVYTEDQANDIARKMTSSLSGSYADAFGAQASDVMSSLASALGDSSNYHTLSQALSSIESAGYAAQEVVSGLQNGSMRIAEDGSVVPTDKYHTIASGANTLSADQLGATMQQMREFGVSSQDIQSFGEQYANASEATVDRAAAEVVTGIKGLTDAQLSAWQAYAQNQTDLGNQSEAAGGFSSLMSAMGTAGLSKSTINGVLGSMTDENAVDIASSVTDLLNGILKDASPDVASWLLGNADWSDTAAATEFVQNAYQQLNEAMGTVPQDQWPRIMASIDPTSADTIYQQVQDEISAKGPLVFSGVAEASSNLSDVDTQTQGLKSLFKQYNSKDVAEAGGFTTEEAGALLAEHPEYIQYLQQEGDLYVLNKKALDSYNKSIQDEKDAIGELNGDTADVSAQRDSLNEYRLAYGDDESNPFSSSIGDLGSLYTSMENNAGDIDTILSQLSDGYTNLFTSIQEQAANAGQSIEEFVANSSNARDVMSLFGDASYKALGLMTTQLRSGRMSVSQYADKVVDLYGSVSKVSKAVRSYDSTQKKATSTTSKATRETTKHEKAVNGMERASNDATKTTDKLDRKLESAKGAKTFSKYMEDSYQRLTEVFADDFKVLDSATDGMGHIKDEYTDTIQGMVDSSREFYDSTPEAFNKMTAKVATALGWSQQQVVDAYNAGGAELTNALMSNADAASAYAEGTANQTQNAITSIASGISGVIQSVVSMIASINGSVTGEVSTQGEVTQPITAEADGQKTQVGSLHIPTFTMALKGGGGVSGGVDASEARGAAESAGWTIDEAQTPYQNENGTWVQDAYKYVEEEGTGNVVKQTRSIIANPLDFYSTQIASGLSTLMGNNGGARLSDYGGGAGGPEYEPVMPTYSDGGGGGKGGGGGGGGGDDYEPDTMDYLDDKADRYERINSLIEDNTKLLDNVKDLEEQLAGSAYVKSLADQVAYLKQDIEYEKEKMRLQEQERSELAAQLQSYGIQFDANGRMLNSYQLLTQKINEINGLIGQYNATGDEAGQDALKDQIDAQQKVFDKISDTVSAYDDLVSNEYDVAEQIRDDQNEIENAYIKVIEKSIEASDSIKELDQNLRKLKMNLDRDFNDGAGINSFVKNLAEAETSVRNITDLLNPNYAGGLNALNDKASFLNEQWSAMADGGLSDYYGDNMQKLIDDSKDVFEKFTDEVEEVIDGLETCYSTIDDAISRMSDRLNRVNTAYSNIKDQIDYYSELTKLLHGEEAYDDLSELIDRKIESDRGIIQANQTALESYRQLLSQFEKGTDQYNAIVEKIASTEQSINEAEKEIQESLRERYENDVNSSLKSLFDKMSKTGLFSDAKFEWQEIQNYSDKWLDDVNKAYQIQKLQSAYMSLADDAKSVKQQEYINKLMDERLNNLRDAKNVSKAQFDYENARLEVLKAQIALQDAQNNKSNMKLSRDSQGNYNYVYTADEDAVRQAQDALADATNNAWNTAKSFNSDLVSDFYSQRDQLVQTMQDIAQDASLTREQQMDQARKAMADFSDYVESLSGNMSMAHLDMQESFIDATESLASENAKSLQDVYGEAQKGIFDNLDQIDERYKTLISDSMGDIDSLRDEISLTGDDIAESAQRMFDDIDDTLAQVSISADKVSDSYRDVADAISEAADSQKDFSDAISQDVDTVTTYQGYLAGLQKNYENVKDSMSKTIQTLKDNIESKDYEVADLRSQLKTVQDELDRKNGVYKGDGAYGSGNGGGGGGFAGTNWSQDDLIEGIAGNIWTYGGWANDPTRHADLSARFGEDIAQAIQNYVNYGMSALMHDWQSGYYSQFDPSAFDTGGYTGDWGDKDGRLAVLHQKEIVLNEDDTRNLLSIVQAARDMVSNMGVTGTYSSIKELVTQSVSGGDVSQNVTISAEFPNATSVDDIKEAIMSLPGVALQHVHSAE